MTFSQERAQSMLAEVNSAGNCVHPIRLAGETINLATGEVRRANLLVPCKDRRVAVCPPCSYLYKADAYIIVASGLRGGKGVAESVVDHAKLFRDSDGAQFRCRSFKRELRRLPISKTARALSSRPTDLVQQET